MLMWPVRNDRQHETHVYFPIAKLDLRDIILNSNLSLIMDVFTVKL